MEWYDALRSKDRCRASFGGDPLRLLDRLLDPDEPWLDRLLGGDREWLDPGPIYCWVW